MECFLGESPLYAMQGVAPQWPPHDTDEADEHLKKGNMLDLTGSSSFLAEHDLSYLKQCFNNELKEVRTKDVSSYVPIKLLSDRQTDR